MKNCSVAPSISITGPDIPMYRRQRPLGGFLCRLLNFTDEVLQYNCRMSLQHFHTFLWPLHEIAFQAACRIQVHIISPSSMNFALASWPASTKSQHETLLVWEVCGMPALSRIELIDFKDFSKNMSYTFIAPLEQRVSCLCLCDDTTFEGLRYTFQWQIAMNVNLAQPLSEDWTT